MVFLSMDINIIIIPLTLLETIGNAYDGAIYSSLLGNLMFSQ